MNSPFATEIAPIWVLEKGASAWAVSGLEIVPITIESWDARYHPYEKSLRIHYYYDLKPFQDSGKSYPAPGHQIFPTREEAQEFLDGKRALLEQEKAEILKRIDQPPYNYVGQVIPRSS